MKIFVTGGAGFIGSHTVLTLLEQGHEVTVCDNFSNSSVEAIRRIESLLGRSVETLGIDLRNESQLTEAITRVRPHAVIHFAGLKSVAESNLSPIQYYENNVLGTVNLVKAMNVAGASQLIFSSSATVYGDTNTMPIAESASLQATNPYGRTKLFIEHMLHDLAASEPSWRIGILRYFNPVGAHQSGRIGEDPTGRPNNLVPFVAQVALGIRDRVTIFGDDYPTHDGTGVRDYIHVLDLAQGHTDALRFISNNRGIHTWNLGTGIPHSVLEVINTFAAVSGRPIPYTVTERRLGDVAVSVADPTRAQSDLQWRATRSLAEMLSDHWHWQSLNPTGYSFAKAT